MKVLEKIKAKSVIRHFIKKNNNQIKIMSKEGAYYLETDLSIDDIIFDNGLTYKSGGIVSGIDLYTYICDKNGNEIAHLRSKNTKNEIEKIEKEKAESKRIEKEKDKEWKEKLAEEQLKNSEKEQSRCEYEFEKYKKFIISNGGNEKIINMPAIHDIIVDGIKYGDRRLIAEGKTIIAYIKPKEDGTFDIGLRMGGPVVTDLYKMSYCDEGSAYIKLVLFDTKTVHYAMDDPVGTGGYDIENETIIFIDKNGNTIDKIVKSK